MTDNYTRTITKSDFKAYCEAPRHLWARVNDKLTQPPSDFDRLLGEQGYQAEALARDYLEQEILQKQPGLKLNWQATFSDGPFEARVDALIYNPGSDRYDLYEIKSSTAWDKEDLVDVGFQTVILDRHIQVAHVYLLHLNKDYALQGALDLPSMFLAEDVSREVEAIKPGIVLARDEALKAAHATDPEGLAHCLSLSECPCPEVCHPDLPGFSIFDVPRLSPKKKQQLLDEGIRAAADIPDDFALNDKQRLVVGRAQTGQPHLDRRALQAELEKYQFPLYFLDYETCISAIPQFPGYHPQQQIVFQYSLHRLDGMDGETVHMEHLSIQEADPALPLLEQLAKDIGSKGTVLVWNKAFEMSRNREMAELYPQHAGFLEQLNQRIEDLGDVISKGIYLHPGFKGSWSIKCVLPVMVPDLSYDGLPIHKGDQASLTWWQLRSGEIKAADRAGIIDAMRHYCELDSLAMVMIYRELRKMV
jgi:hypothetical protein